MADRIAFVGTGPDPDEPDSDGYAMAYRHAAGYERIDGCELIACADLVPANAEAFAAHHDIDPSAVYEDTQRMLRETRPDVVSVCVPPDAHADVVTACATTGVPDAIHCEKPMATTWADCQRMVEACERADVQLTINHQRRVGPIYRRAKELVDEGRIGDLQRVEWSEKNLFDSGTHLFDLTTLYADGTPQWMLAGLAYRDENRWFGVHNENQAIAQWRYDSGVTGLAVTGESADVIDPTLALQGTDGRIEIGASAGPPLRYLAPDTGGWEEVDVGENEWGDHRPSTPRAGLMAAAEALPGVSKSQVAVDYPSHIDRAIAEVIDAYRTGRESTLAAETAMEGTELIFAAYESVRRRDRVELPLDVDDNPLESMVTEGLVAVGRE